MGKYVVSGGNTLLGEIEINGAKNAVLPILSAVALNSGITVLNNVPALSDTKTAISILRELGCKVEEYKKTLIIDSTYLIRSKISATLAEKMRSSVIFLGTLLARLGEAEIPYPGGCCLGSRPVDLHIKALKQLGVEFFPSENTIKAKCKQLKGAEITLAFPSVGATQNIILAAVYAEGETVINNVALEPEIDDMCNLLNQMGAKIKGIGTSQLIIKGVKALHSTEYAVMSDRIEAGTYMCCVAAAGGELMLRNAVPELNIPLINTLKQVGCEIKLSDNNLFISRKGNLSPIDYIETAPYPYFPTDMQAQLMAVLVLAEGKSTIKENIFESRYRHALELNKMGANIQIINNNCFNITGTSFIKGTEVCANDLRGGAALIIAALAAKGTSVIEGVEYILRGYEDIDKHLAQAGGDIRYIE